MRGHYILSNTILLGSISIRQGEGLIRISHDVECQARVAVQRSRAVIAGDIVVLFYDRVVASRQFCGVGARRCTLYQLMLCILAVFCVNLEVRPYSRLFLSRQAGDYLGEGHDCGGALDCDGASRGSRSGSVLCCLFRVRAVDGAVELERISARVRVGVVVLFVGSKHPFTFPYEGKVARRDAESDEVGADASTRRCPPHQSPMGSLWPLRRGPTSQALRASSPGRGAFDCVVNATVEKKFTGGPGGAACF